MKKLIDFWYSYLHANTQATSVSHHTYQQMIKGASKCRSNAPVQYMLPADLVCPTVLADTYVRSLMHSDLNLCLNSHFSLTLPVAQHIDLFIQYGVLKPSLSEQQAIIGQLHAARWADYCKRKQQAIA